MTLGIAACGLASLLAGADVEGEKGVRNFVPGMRVSGHQKIDRSNLVSLDESDTPETKEREKERRSRMVNYNSKPSRPVTYRVVYESTVGGPNAVLRTSQYGSASPAQGLPMVVETTTASGEKVYVPIQTTGGQAGQYYKPSSATYRVIERE